MSVELRVLSGARAGQRERFDKSVIAIGRHPLSDLRFDPEADRDVSSRHAEIRVVEGRVLLRDTQSTNGTFVNGRRIAEETELRPGDVLSFGENGPKTEFRFAVVPDTAAVAAAPPASGPPTAGRRAPSAPVPSMLSTTPSAPAPRRSRGNTGERIAIAVQEHTRGLRYMLYGLGVLLILAVSGAYWIGHREAAAQAAQLDELLRRNATLSRAYDSEITRMAGTMTGLDSALADAKRETDALRTRLQQDRDRDPGAANVAEWSRRLTQAEQRHQRLASAASMDASAVADANGSAVTLIAVEMPDGRTFSGTGFGVTRDGLIVTNRHLVQDERGQPVKRVMVIFSDTRQWLPARVTRTSPGEDLALLQIETAGPFPTVEGIAGDGELPTVGAPVVLIGYPLGTATAGMTGDVSHITARSTLGVGTVSKRLADVLQIDAYAGEGSSGSPVFDARGRVVGVVYGGATESGGRIVYAVPATRLAAQLPASAR